MIGNEEKHEHMTVYNMRIIIKDRVIILAYNQKTIYNMRIIIKYRTNIYAHNLEEL